MTSPCNTPGACAALNRSCDQCDHLPRSLFSEADRARVIELAADQVWRSMQRCEGIPESWGAGTAYIDGRMHHVVKVRSGRAFTFPMVWA